MKNKTFLTLIALLANFILAGYATQFGMLIEPLAATYAITVEHAAVGYSCLNGGALIGTLIGFVVIDKIPFKLLALSVFGSIAAATFTLFASHLFVVFEALFTFIGIMCGIGLCIAGSIIVKIWSAKIQGALLLAQDMMFNISGVVLGLFTTYLLTQKLPWSYGYQAVGLITLCTLIMVVFSHFRSCENVNEHNDLDVESSAWNFGLTIAFVGVILAMLGLYAFLTWAPLFIKAKFHIPFEEAGEIITRFWTSATVGALVSALLVTRIHVKVFLPIIIALSAIILVVMLTTDNLSIVWVLAYCYGLVGAAVNPFVAFGVASVKKPNNKHIAILLAGSSAGAMFGPALSSLCKSTFGLANVMYAIPVLYVLVFCLIIVQLLRSR